jgi:hypothetical protein
MKKENKKLMRGMLSGDKRTKRIKFAPRSDAEKYDALAAHFFKNILKMNADECFWSDESRLSDFATFFDDKQRIKDMEKFVKRIKSTYKISIDFKRDDLTLIKLFDKIEKEGLIS